MSRCIKWIERRMGMDSIEESILQAALLHDIGKLVMRAEGLKEEHSIVGYNYLKKIQEETGTCFKSEVLDAVRYHHERNLLDAHVDSDHIAFLICEADNVSAGMDRRKLDLDGTTYWDKNSSLRSIFNLIDGDAGGLDKALDLKILKQTDANHYPKNEESIIISQQRYAYILSDFDKAIKKYLSGKLSIHSLLKTIELSLYSVPSSTDVSQQRDISLYQHSKTTAMIASCLHKYCKANGISDYKKKFIIEKQVTRNEKSLLMISGDFSGIQDFIYTVSSKGALKALRGRSFYLEMLCEHIIDELLENLSLSRTNLLYSGGGHFYIIGANTEENRKIAQEANQKINSWLVEQYGTRLYLSMGIEQASCNDLGNNLGKTWKEDNLLGGLYKKVGEAVSRQKRHRYQPNQLKNMMIDKLETEEADGSRECSVCGISKADWVENDEITVCRNCQGMLELGNMLPRIGKYDDAIEYYVVVEGNTGEQIMRVPDLGGGSLGINILTQEEAIQRIEMGTARRVYSLNSDSFGKSFATNIWAGTYSATSDDSGLVTLESLASRCEGVKRIGVLRADVDNLGNTFKKAFIAAKSDHPYQFVSVSRSATLSYELSMFFRHEINHLCSKGIGDEGFRLNSKARATEGYNVSIVYSGGDDVFIIGAWDEVFEFAINFNRAFRRYTQNKMSISAGFSMFHPKFPINKMASITEILESTAKEYPDKDAICLFGAEYDSLENGEKIYNHVYHWNELEENVLSGKFRALKGWIDFDATPEEEDESKVPYSATFFYRLRLQLIELMKNKEPVNIARIAYALARMEPNKNRLEKCERSYKEFKEKLFSWVQDEQHRKELITAMTLLVYLYREDEKND